LRKSFGGVAGLFTQGSKHIIGKSRTIAVGGPRDINMDIKIDSGNRMPFVSLEAAIYGNLSPK